MGTVRVDLLDREDPLPPLPDSKSVSQGSTLGTGCLLRAPCEAGGWETEAWTEVSVLRGETRQNQTLPASPPASASASEEGLTGTVSSKATGQGPGQTLPFPGLGAGVILAHGPGWGG